MGKELLAYCGLYCSACSFKVAYEENNREHILNMPSKYDELKKKPLQFCPGCKLDEQNIDCTIKNCAKSKILEHCGLCKEFPCDKIMKFSNDGIPHHEEALQNLNSLRSIDIEKWLEEQKNKWICKCGQKLSWYLRKCPQFNK